MQIFIISFFKDIEKSIELADHAWIVMYSTVCTTTVMLVSGILGKALHPNLVDMRIATLTALPGILASQLSVVREGTAHDWMCSCAIMHWAVAACATVDKPCIGRWKDTS